MTVKLTPQQTRKIIILSQLLQPGRLGGSAIGSTLSTIEHLGYIQLDTIAVIQRAHHHSLWNRDTRYRAEHLDALLEERKIFEYWSHAASYLPMSHFRFSLPRKQAIASGASSHWYQRDERLMRSILKRIDHEGPLTAGELEHQRVRGDGWGAGPAKQALENLYMQGDLMITRRSRFQKVYDLTERVLPDSIDTSTPTEEEYLRFLIDRYLRAQGIGDAGEIAYLQRDRDLRKRISMMLREMIGAGELIKVEACGRSYAADPSALGLLNRRISRRKATILSPFDNLIIQRKRTREIFDFDYILECYTPASKRRFGYFALPILFAGELVARMDCKADRSASVMHILHLAVEPGSRRKEGFIVSLVKELQGFLHFNGCRTLVLHRCTPAVFEQELRGRIREFIR